MTQLNLVRGPQQTGRKEEAEQLIRQALEVFRGARRRLPRRARLPGSARAEPPSARRIWTTPGGRVTRMRPGRRTRRCWSVCTPPTPEARVSGLLAEVCQALAEYHGVSRLPGVRDPRARWRWPDGPSSWSPRSRYLEGPGSGRVRQRPLGRGHRGRGEVPRNPGQPRPREQGGRHRLRVGGPGRRPTPRGASWSRLATGWRRPGRRKRRGCRATWLASSTTKRRPCCGARSHPSGPWRPWRHGWATTPRTSMPAGGWCTGCITWPWPAAARGEPAEARRLWSGPSPQLGAVLALRPGHPQALDSLRRYLVQDAECLVELGDHAAASRMLEEQGRGELPGEPRAGGPRPPATRGSWSVASSWPSGTRGSRGDRARRPGRPTSSGPEPWSTRRRRGADDLRALGELANFLTNSPIPELYGSERGGRSPGGRRSLREVVRRVGEAWLVLLLSRGSGGCPRGGEEGERVPWRGRCR